MAELVQFYRTGRRKTSVARVFLRSGQGRILINRRPFEGLLPAGDPPADRDAAARAHGDDLPARREGERRRRRPVGAAGAVRHGIARALLEFNTELRTRLKRAGMLARPRMKERKSTDSRARAS